MPEKNRKGSNRFLFTFNTMIIFIVVIVLILYTIFFNAVVLILNATTQKQNEAYLENISSYFNDTMQRAEMTCLRLYLDENIRYFLNTDSIRKEDGQVMAVQETVRQEMLKNPDIHSIYLYFRKQNKVITTESIFQYDDFVNKKWHEFGVRDFGARVITPVWTVIETGGKNGNKADIVSIVRYFPVYKADNMGAVIVNINIDREKKALAQLDNLQKSRSFLINPAGTIEISGDGKNTKGNIYTLLGKTFEGDNISGETVVYKNMQARIFSSSKTYFMWSVLQVYPMMNLIHQYSKLWAYFVTSIVLCIFAFIILMKFNIRMRRASFVNGRPVRSIVDAIDSENRIILRGLFDSILNMQNPLDGKQTEELARLGLPMENYIVLLLKLKKGRRNDTDGGSDPGPEEALDRINLEINNYSSGYCIFKKPDEFIVILNIPEDHMPDIRQFIKNIAESLLGMLKDIFKCSIGIAAGKHVERLAQLCISLETARAMDKAIWFHKADCIIYYEEYNKHKVNYLYDTEAERKLTDAVKNGNEHQAVKCLDSFIDALTAENHFSPENVYQGMMQLTCSMIRIINDNRIDHKLFQNNDSGIPDSLINQFLRMESLHATKVWLCEIIKKICDYFWDVRGGSANESLIRHVKEYISGNLEKSLSLTSVAGVFKISESYLSRIFKQKTGENFLEFLNKSRIQRAKEILAGTSASISDVSARVGFENVQTFIRVFKGFEGITPGVFKEQLQRGGSTGRK